MDTIFLIILAAFAGLIFSPDAFRLYNNYIRKTEIWNRVEQKRKKRLKEKEWKAWNNNPMLQMCTWDGVWQVKGSELIQGSATLTYESNKNSRKEKGTLKAEFGRVDIPITFTDIKITPKKEVVRMLDGVIDYNKWTIPLFSQKVCGSSIKGCFKSYADDNPKSGRLSEYSVVYGTFEKDGVIGSYKAWNLINCEWYYLTKSGKRIPAYKYNEN